MVSLAGEVGELLFAGLGAGADPASGYVGDREPPLPPAAVALAARGRYREMGIDRPWRLPSKSERDWPQAWGRSVALNGSDDEARAHVAWLTVSVRRLLVDFAECVLVVADELTRRPVLSGADIEALITGVLGGPTAEIHGGPR